MVANMHHIYMNYQQLLKSARELEDVADQLERLRRDKVAGYVSCSRAWSGDAGAACREKVTKLNNSLSKRIKELRKAAQNLRTTAKAEYELEMALAAISGV